MSKRITDTLVKTLHVPPNGHKITYDGDLKGFCVRVTSGGARLSY
ncbi:MAG: hypothetical protein ACRETL_14415 [Gammaproteobacteria bacterium]